MKQPLLNIGYDMDDRGGAWGDSSLGDINKDLPWGIEDINEIVNSMTKENAVRVIWDKGFLPGIVAVKFAELLSLE